MTVPPSNTLEEAMSRIQQGEVLVISNRRRGALIVCKPYRCEFLGPGSVLGGNLDRTCTKLIPIGKFSLAAPRSAEELYRAYLIRRQWTLNTRHLTEIVNPCERAQQFLNQLENYFSPEIIRRISTEDLASIVGVFPRTMLKVLTR
ncbi:MAG: hypothetical protein ACO3EZ_02585 [Prochlorotrichaceae cyanobacterium]|jgi:hypothetical protein